MEPRRRLCSARTEKNVPKRSSKPLTNMVEESSSASSFAAAAHGEVARLTASLLVSGSVVRDGSGPNHWNAAVSADGGELRDMRVAWGDVADVIAPLAVWIRGKCRGGADRPVVVGISGAGGSGKTTMAALLRLLLERTMGDDSDGRVAVFGMDSCHMTNARLDEMGVRADKGLPATYDLAKFRRHLDDATSGRPALLPQYDRGAHDPAEGRVAVGPRCRVLLVEGLFVLSDAGTRERLDASIHLDVTLDGCRERLMARKRLAGEDERVSAARFMRVDAANHATVSAAAAHADVTVRVLSAAGGAGRCYGVVGSGSQ